MIFTDRAFLFVFLPAVAAAYWALVSLRRQSLTVPMLALASVLFYAIGNLSTLWIISASMVLNFFAAKAILRFHASKSAIATGAIAANLAALMYFKYYNFFVADVFGGTAASIILPVGISFFTFTQIAFLVDCCKGVAREPDFTRYALFVTYFPHLVAGPIFHHAEMMPQFAQTRRPPFSQVVLGMVWFTLGLAKKVLVADNLAPYAENLFRSADGARVEALDAWVGVLAYSFQIYFDFSGYSDMACGMSLLFGIRLPINFLSPYKSRNIIAFWRRWHMTLSRYLKDYVYIPLGGNRRGSRMLNLLLTMLIGGLWHGAGWGFVVWGLLHGLYLAANHWMQGRPWLAPIGRVPWLGIACTQLAVVVAWVPFRASSLEVTAKIWAAMFGMSESLERFAPGIFDAGERWAFAGDPVLAGFWIAVAAAIAFLLPNSVQIVAGHRYALPKNWRLPAGEGPVAALKLSWPLAAATGSLLALASFVAYRAAPRIFIYFQF